MFYFACDRSLSGCLAGLCRRGSKRAGLVKLGVVLRVVFCLIVMTIADEAGGDVIAIVRRLMCRRLDCCVRWCTLQTLHLLLGTCMMYLAACVVEKFHPQLSFPLSSIIVDCGCYGTPSFRLHSHWHEHEYEFTCIRGDSYSPRTGGTWTSRKLIILAIVINVWWNCFGKLNCSATQCGVFMSSIHRTAE